MAKRLTSKTVAPHKGEGLTCRVFGASIWAGRSRAFFSPLVEEMAGRPERVLLGNLKPP